MRRREYLGYGVATIADSAPYSFVTVYMLLYLTTVAGLSPVKAGMVSSVAIIFHGIWNAVLGYISDNTRSKYGRRRPYLLAAIPLLLIGMVMMFSLFQVEESLKISIYIFAGILFWSGFGMYYTPYAALGAELTDDYDQRTTLRTYARVFGIFGNLIGMVLPLAAVSLLSQKGMSESSAWQSVALIIAAISVVSILITWRSTRGKEKIKEAQSEKYKLSVANIFLDYWVILRLKPFKYLIGVIVMFTMANTMYNSSMVFFARYSLGLHDEITSSVFLITIVANLLLTPVITFLAKRWGKKDVMVFSMAVTGIGCIVLKIIGIDSYSALLVYVCIFSLSYSCYWQIINAILYDISEVGEFVTGKRMEGSILSIFCLVGAISMSVSTQLMGLVLKLGGYNVQLQELPQSAVNVIELMFTLIPGCCLLIAVAFQYKYPLNQHRFTSLKEAIKDRNEGREINTESLKDII